jgi:hypothetical protein
VVVALTTQVPHADLADQAAAVMVQRRRLPQLLPLLEQLIPEAAAELEVCVHQLQQLAEEVL